MTLDAIKHSDEVFYAKNKIVKVNDSDIKQLKSLADENIRKRMRLCAHSTPDDLTHEMLILLGKDSYIRPHKHTGRNESFHIIEGCCDLLIFTDEGKMLDIFSMGDYKSGLTFYYRISLPLYHSLLIKSDYLIFHETTQGPFNKSDTLFAPWSPEESDVDSGNSYLSRCTLSFTKQTE